MEIIMKSMAEIKPYENNPRNNDEAVKYVAESIKQFGFKVPMVIDADGVIVAGHTRFKAAKELGMTEVPCIIADDLTEEQVKAFRLADNKVGEIATWDFELLHLELDALEDLDFDMGDFFYDGFDEDEFDHLFESQRETKEEKKDEQVESVTFKVVIEAESEEEALEIMEALKGYGYEAEVIS